MTISTADFEGSVFLIERVLLAEVFAFMTGPPAATKTLVALDFAARLTRGKAPGDFKGEQINVLYISVEGGFKKSIGPRFKAAGGNFDRFKCVEEVIMLPSNVKRLRQLIKAFGARLVIIDPIKDHLDARVYSSPLLTAQSLRKLHTLAEETHCSVLGIDWPSKSARKGDLSVSGNQAFSGVPRNLIVVGRLKRDEWVVGASKASDADDLTGWIYTVEGKPIGKAANGKELTPRVVKWIRQATTSEVLRAREQADIEEDPHLLALLQFMAPSPSDKDAEPYETEVLIDYLNKVELIGKNKCRSLLNSARDAGYVESTHDGQGGKYKVTWTITDVGKLVLAPDEESVEAAIGKLFPSMNPDVHEPLPDQLALPSGINGEPRKRIVKRISKPARRSSKGGA